MPVEQAPSRKPPRSRNEATVVRYHDYIEEKIESTRRAVKVVDLATALVELAVSVLLFLLLAVVVEHWFVSGGFPSFIRAALFGVLVVGVGYFAYRRVWPLCIRAINPVYAAQTIEHSTPTLKNGLINLLLFRQHRQEIPDAVYRTLEEQAAHGLTRAPVETAVDRGELIRLGYVLIAIVAVAALYKVFSPKDPFVAAERVLMPWADIVPASRVTISEVTPGSVTISRGEYLDVSVEVRGLSDDDTVVLRYTTEDGQIVGRSIPLKKSSDGLQFTGRLADDSATNNASAGAGITRNLKYRLEAGDARTRNYSVQVVPAASILVERIDYHYPPYTGFVDNSVDGVGDIRAIEGTRVTVHSRANGPIRDANVDFDADGRPDLKMSTVDLQAQAAFDLALRDDRQTPTHASYVLRFTNDEGRTNRVPVKHSIHVEPDLVPEAEIRQPQEKLRDVRLDEQVTIEVEARDPDFALRAVRLRGQVMGSDAVNELLLKNEQRGRFNGRFVLLPSAHGLKVGDVLEYWAEADDNRAPKPNTVATEHKSLRVVSPNPAQQPPPDQMAKNDRQQPGGDEGERGRQGDKETGRQGEGQDGKGKAGESASADGEAGKERQGDKETRRQGDEQSGQGQAGQEGEGKESNQDGGSSAKNGNQGTSGQKLSDGKSAAQDSATESTGKAQGQEKEHEKQTGAGTAGGESSKDGAQPRGARPDENQSQQGGNNKPGEGQQQSGSRQNGDQKPQAGEKEAPVSSQGDNDAEVFERIQKRLQKTGDLKREEGGPDKETKEQKGESTEKQGGRETEGQKEQKPGESASANGERKKGAGDSDKAAQSEKAEPKSNEPGQGKGTDTRNNDSNQQGAAKSDKQDPQQSLGSEQTSAKGSPGGGEKQKNQGSPNSQPGMKPTEKPNQAESKGDKSNQQEPPAGANSKRESDSHGDQGGDKAGGGQKSPHDGTGSAGANQSADKGAGQSGEKGKGENSAEAGKDAKSQERTGAGDGKTAGKGSEQREGVGERSGGEAEKERQGDTETRRQGDKEKDEQGNNEPGESASADGKSNEKKTGTPQDVSKMKDQQNGDAKNQKGPAGSSENFGQPNGAFNPQPSITGEAPKGDDANLEYARKQTDLVLDKLADQLKKKRVDEGLLKDLGWSEAELKKFIERWQQRKAAAEKNDATGETARRELDDALRSLGLRRGELQQNAVQKDTMRDLREGYRGPVPTEYKDRLRAYNQGVSRARQNGE